MRVFGYIPSSRWTEFEMEFNERSGLNACIIDGQGVRVSAYRRWANPLCPVIRREPMGQAAICEGVRDILLACKPEEGRLECAKCSAGLAILGIQVFHKDRFAGLVGGCGLLPEGGRVDALLVSRATGLGLKRIQELGMGVGVIRPPEIRALGHYLRQRFAELRQDGDMLTFKEVRNDLDD